MTTQEILQECSAGFNLKFGWMVTLPQIQLDRKEYLEIKKALELIGGKWKGGNAQGFLFEEDPTELLRAQANGEQRNLKKEYQFFATPQELANRMIELLLGCSMDELTVEHRLSLDKKKILEPSAGDGALVKALTEVRFVHVDCFEAMDLNRMKLENVPGAYVIGNDFLMCEDKENYYDIIIANPPFSKNQDILHICKMYEVLRPGGTLITISSKSWFVGSQKMQKDFHEFLTGLGADIEEIKEGAFADSGTMVGSLLIKIMKPVVDAPEIPNSIHHKLWALHSLSKNKESISTEDSEGGKAIFEKAISMGESLITDLENDNETKKEEYRSPSEILDDIEKNMQESTVIFNDLKQILSPNKNIEMDFFKKLFELSDADVTLHIKRKNDKLTISLMPEAANQITPIIITGTPEELDEEFFNKINPALENATELSVINSKSIAAEDKRIDDLASKPKTKSKEPKKAEKSKAEKVAEPALFGDDDSDIGNPTSEDDDENSDDENEE